MFHQSLEESSCDDEDEYNNSYNNNINKNFADTANLRFSVNENNSAGEESKNEERPESNKKSKRTKYKATTFDAITNLGPYYCIINAYRLDENRPHV